MESPPITIFAAPETPHLGLVPHRGELPWQEEERLLWESMEDFILENPTPAYPPVLSSPAPTPRYIVLCLEIKLYINIAGLAKSTTRPAFLKGAMFSTLLIGTKLTKVKCLPEISLFMMASLIARILSTGQTWMKPHTAYVAPSGAKFSTIVGLLAHYHRYNRHLA